VSVSTVTRSARWTKVSTLVAEVIGSYGHPGGEFRNASRSCAEQIEEDNQSQLVI